MKRKGSYILFILCIALGITACNSEESIDYASSIQELETQMRGQSLLKTVATEEDNYLLSFEDNVIQVPIRAVQSITTDADSWETNLTLTNGKTYKISTLGSSIDKFITDVQVNPSKYNPLAASVAVNLPALGYMKIIVHSKPGKKTQDITYSFKSAEQAQNLTILGLYPNYTNTVTLIYSDMQGNERARSDIQIKTEALTNPRLPRTVTIPHLNMGKMEPGMTLVNSPGESEADTSIPFMIDADGDIRWTLDWVNHPVLSHIGIGCGLTRMANGHYLTGDGNHHLLLEVDVYGDIVHKWDLNAMGYSFHHAASETEKGYIMATVSKVTAKLSNGKDPRINDFIIKFDPEKGEVLKEWDLVNMLDSTRYNLTGGSLADMPYDQTASNWAHNNGILQIGNDYLATARYQGIFKFNENGGVKWIISPHKSWRMKYQNMLLTPLHSDGTPITDPDVIAGTKGCEDFEWPWGVHAAVLLPNGHYMAFDNGYGRYFAKLPPDGEESFSRAVEYEVNEENMTVRQVWQYGKERGNEFYALARSSTQYLPQTGNRLIGSAMMNDFGGGRFGSRVVEVDPQTQEVVYEAELEDAIFQRVLRMPLYPDGL